MLASKCGQMRVLLGQGHARGLPPAAALHLKPHSSSSSSSSRSPRQTQRSSRRGVRGSAVAEKAGVAPARETVFTDDPANNVSDYVYEKMGMELHNQGNHPICIIKQVCARVCGSMQARPAGAPRTSHRPGCWHPVRMRACSHACTHDLLPSPACGLQGCGLQTLAAINARMGTGSSVQCAQAHDQDRCAPTLPMHNRQLRTHRRRCLLRPQACPASPKHAQ